MDGRIDTESGAGDFPEDLRFIVQLVVPVF